tara:strand:- start:115 stop:363 length:249 start_codon:yes stop_codon:yes gene_type:complete
MEIKIKNIIKKKVNNNITKLGLEVKNFNDDTEILKSGIIDSLDFVELMTSIEKETGIKSKTFLENETSFNISVNWFIEKLKN